MSIIDSIIQNSITDIPAHESHRTGIMDCHAVPESAVGIFCYLKYWTMSHNDIISFP